MTQRLTLEDFKKIAQENGGDCVSQKYTSMAVKLEFVCKEGHQWFANPNDIKTNKSWCPFCAGKVKKTSLDLLNLIAPFGWKCLDVEKFETTKTLLNFECQFGHRWITHYNRIYVGTNCPVCVNRAKLTIEFLQELAKEKSGKLLSTEYVSNKKKLLWECNKGHQFWMAANMVKNSQHQWCPQCSEYKAESMCRKIFQELFDKQFCKVRPKWLMGNKGMPLELDGYCQELNLAFEYNGIQHYKFTPTFHKTHANLVAQQARDQMKLTLCNDLGIMVIVIPYMVKFTKQSLYKVIISLLTGTKYAIAE